MQILIAPDKFAGTLTAEAATEAIAAGWRVVRPRDDIDPAPLSDGGPGFLDVLGARLGGRIETVATSGPNGAPARARILWVEAEVRTAYLEAADCCGLHLAPTPRQPLAATSAGLVGPLRRALAEGAGCVVVGVGGTASTDGGRELVGRLGSWPATVELVVATDVAQPLLGPAGAARSFSPQKGATPEEVDRLEQRLTDWSRAAGLEPDEPGAGAGGGLAYGLMTLGARRESGAELVAEASNLPVRLCDADLVITGEGAVDFSSLRGKVVGTVGRLAMAVARPCVVLAGRADVGRREAAAAGLDEVHAITDRVDPGVAEEAPMRELAALAERVARQWRG